MRILSMQATFGKLENETITFQPGLNIIQAPNEWGKSTWCAFISAMLYGIDTRERTALADKRRYAPWSGKPMSGRMELLWQGKKIAIERSTKGRTIFGTFSAYETESGLPVPGMTGDNCGVMLLGVEKSVFERSVFIRHSDLPITQDEALRRRLHALVTTGDETGASDRLAQKLRDLKNKCRHNKTGLLPAAESNRSQIVDRLARLDRYREQIRQLTCQEKELEQEILLLQNHQDALAYEAAQADLRQLNIAREDLRTASQAEKALSTACSLLPTREEAQNSLEKLNLLQAQLNELRQQPAPPQPTPPALSQPFRGLDAGQAQAMVQQDIGQYEALTNKKQYAPYIITSVFGLILSVILATQKISWYILPILLCGLSLVIKGLFHMGDRKKRIRMECKYGSPDTAQWETALREYIQTMDTYEKATAGYEAGKSRLQQHRDNLERQVQEITQGAPIHAAQKYWSQVLRQYEELEQARKDTARMQAHVRAMQSVVRSAPAPAMPDALLYSPEETEKRLKDALAQKQYQQKLLAQAQGQACALGERNALEQELDETNRQIQKLEAVYQAAVLAQETLEQTAQELQRRFAPRISRQAAEHMAYLTDGRYDRLTLDRDLQLHAKTKDETNLQTWQWRSDGTVDQLYLALRLAVAEELAPEAPMILDDALVLFDEKRLQKALELLSQTAIHRQVILFSCQNREKTYINP